MDYWFGTFAPERVFVDLNFIQIYWYSLLVVSGIIAAYFVVRRIFIRSGRKEAEYADAVLYAVVGGLIGARIWHVFVFQWEYYSQHVSEIIRIWEGGIAIQGALVGGAVALYFFAKKRKQKLFYFTDYMMIGLPLGQAVGRWGNFFNQELFGKPTTLPWGIYIEEANRIPGFEGATHFHPVFLYESILNLILFFFLFYLGKKEYHQGLITGSYLIGYGMIRFVVDFIRIDPMPMLLGIRSSQYISIALLCIGIFIVWRAYTHGVRRAVAKD